VFSRVIHASRVDLFLCVAGVLPPLVIGTLVGLLSGYFGGVVDSIFMRLYDLTVAFPFFVLVLAIVGVIGPGLFNFILALTIVGWVSYARLIRAEVLSIRESEYVRAAECLGYPKSAILFHHVLPNAIGPVIAYAVSDAVLVMLAGASFGYLGMGAQPPLAEWGVIIADGQAFIQQAWWICLFPGLAAISLGLGFAFLGESLGQLQRRETAA
jgi:peptide/nickel transport system permease protein